VTCIDISRQLDVRLDRSLTNAVVQTVRGTVKVGTNAVLEDAFTRMIMSMGIVWADSSFVDPGDVFLVEGPNFPNPLSESMKWIWRHNYIVSGYVPALSQDGNNIGNFETANSVQSIDVHVKVKRKQPSINHRLYFCYSKTLPAAGFDTNLAATPAQVTGAVNVLMKTP